MEVEKSIPAKMEQIADAICRKYCKYPEHYTDETLKELLEEICEKCPVQYLM